MSKAKFIQENGETILPITHEEVVLDNNGKNLPSKYQQKQDENLLTESKTIVGAINELSTKGSEGFVELENKVAELDNMTKFLNDVVFDHSTQIGTETLNTNSQTLSGAINELFQSANNGKELIASSIGEPLSADDTFQAMSNDINSLLSTFKTNMMNNGITVASGDKFKQLIDKISSLADNEGKGIQYAEGTGNLTKGVQFAEGTYTRTEDFLPLTTNVVYNLNFTPTFVLLNIGNMVECCANYNMYNVWISNLNQTVIPSKSGDGYSYKLQLTDITNSSFNITNNSTYGIGYINNIKWYAIGVGEEDTTLRDSLASILGDKGVDVSDEDDMASLISKVDSIETGVGLDIISATELPATGKEGQICVVMDTPCDAFMITSNLTSSISDKVVLYTSNLGSSYLYSTGNLSYELYFFKTLYNGSSYSSYYWSNNQWNTLTVPYLMFLEDGRYTTEGTTVSGGLYTGDSNKRISYTEGTGLVNNPYNAGVYMFATFNNTIDLSRYNRVEFTVSTTVGGSGKFTLFTSQSRTNSYNGSQYGSIVDSISYSHTANANVPVVYSFDISSWNNTSAYLGVSFYQGASNQKFIITDFYLY